MKLPLSLKKPFGTAKMVRIKSVRYLSWEDAFDVDFDDGLSFLEPHRTIRKANKIDPKARPVEVLMDQECRIGFEVRYDNGQNSHTSKLLWKGCGRRFYWLIAPSALRDCLFLTQRMRFVFLCVLSALLVKLYLLCSLHRPGVCLSAVTSRG